jgi:MFS transporter, DHA1 family, tetracycline resistance protein
MPQLASESSATTGQNGRGALLTIFLIVFIDLMGFGIVLPNLQLYGHDFGITNYFVLTLIGATYSFFQFVFAPILGRWSDRIGRRPVLIISQAGTLVGFLILYAAHFFQTSDVNLGIALIFLSRIIDGISGGNISTASAYIADITPPEKRAKGLGLIGAAFGLGFVFGPLIGGLTAYHLGLRYVPLVAAGFSLTALILTITYVAESLDPAHRPTDLRRYSLMTLPRAVARPVIGPLILMFFVNGFAFAGMEQTLSLLIQKRVFSTSPAATMPMEKALDYIHFQDKSASLATGYLFFAIGLIVAFIQGGMIHRLTKRLGEPLLVISGPAFIAVGLVIIGLPTSWPWTGFAVGSAFLAIGSSIFNPSLQSLISRHAKRSEQGEILGANQGMASLARATGPILAGLFFEYLSPESPYYISAALCFLVSIWAIGIRSKLVPPAATAEAAT